MTRKNILLIGGGGHAHSCIEVILSTTDYGVAGIVDPTYQVDTPQDVLGFPLWGRDEDLPTLRQRFDYALVTVGQIKTAALRMKLFELLKQLEFALPPIIASTAVVSRYAQIGEGTVVMHQAVIDAGTVVGANCIVNTGALAAHDCNIGDHSHLSLHAVICGNVRIGKCCYIGANATVVQDCNVDDYTFVRAADLVKPPTFVSA